MNHRIVIATSNRGKFSEIEFALRNLRIQLLSLADFSHVPEALEEGNGFEEIARNKAKHYHDRIQLPVLAEDSGLVVESLNGFPGIHSARIAPNDAQRIKIILDQLRGKTDRAAFYHCSMVFIAADKEIETGGRCEGIIIDAPRGNLGFGYDPIFKPLGSDRTFGEMDLGEKAKYSHRGHALNQILPQLTSWIRNHQ